MRFAVWFVSCLLIASNALAKTEPLSWCGTHGHQRTHYSLRMHEKHKKELALQGPVTPGATVDVGEIAVIKGDSNTVIPPNRFDLPGRRVKFVERATYTLRVSSDSISSTQGNPTSLSDDDSQKIEFTSGFTFRFYGTTYTSVFVNTDGNLTFNKKDKASTPRGAFRFLEGPPRIAPFFVDLNPEEGGEVRVHQSSDFFRVTWNSVPEFDTSDLNTFQVTLFKSGNIEFVYSSSVATSDAIVGISPGKANVDAASFIDYSETGKVSGLQDAVLERFVGSREIDLVAVAQKFYETHPNKFDFLTIFTDVSYLLDPEDGFAFFLPIQNHDEGIGLSEFDDSTSFGGARLEGVLFMDRLGNYPLDPNQTFLGTNTTLDILGQENGHRWLAYPQVMINGVPTEDLLGRDNVHWSFFMDSDASDMEGNDIRDNGNNTFTTVAATETYSKLDRYMMGLIPPSSVPSFFFVQTTGDKSRPPEIGVTFNGARVNVTVDQIIQVHGERKPSSENSQKVFREAFIYFIQSGTTADPSQVAQVDTIRKMWSSYFRKATGGLSKMRTTLP